MYKKIVAIILCALALIAFSSCEKEEPICGGWTKETEAINYELIEIFNKALANSTYKDLTPKKLVARQVVSGINYKFMCEDKDHSTKYVVVYKDLKGNCSITSVLDK